jgi:hypothetical protein
MIKCIKMNMYDPNSPYIYNQYLIYTGGIHPTPEQYNRFAHNFYYFHHNQQMYHMYSMPQPMLQPIPQQTYQDTSKETSQDENFIIDVKQPEHTMHPSTKVNRNCKLNMQCRDKTCLFFHHPFLE